MDPPRILVSLMIFVYLSSIIEGFGVTFRGHRDHFFRLEMKIGHPGHPRVIFPDIKSHFGGHFGVSFGTCSQKA